MHDRKGNPLEVGDKVYVPCVITNISATEEYCNCTVQTEELMPPYTHESGIVTISLNTKQVEKQ